MIQGIRNSFLDFFVKLFKDYHKFMDEELMADPNKLSGVNFTSCFNQEAFLRKCPDR